MTINGMILAVPIVAACMFMLAMLYVTIEEACVRRREEDI